MNLFTVDPQVKRFYDVQNQYENVGTSRSRHRKIAKVLNDKHRDEANESDHGQCREDEVAFHFCRWFLGDCHSDKSKVLFKYLEKIVKLNHGSCLYVISTSNEDKLNRFFYNMSFIFQNKWL
jgi:hypothetical protein